MSSQDIVKGVSRNLKYYFDVRRREEGFDLSGPASPRQDHPPTKPRPTLMYDGLHDKPVKHYFSKPKIRKTLTHMRVPAGKENEEAKMKNNLQKFMKKYKFVHSFYPSYPHIPRSAGFGVQMKKQKSGLKGGRPLLRAAPSHSISKREAERIITMATKLLVATEMYDIQEPRPVRRKCHSAPRSFESSVEDGLPRIDGDSRSSNRRSPKPPRRLKYVYDINGRRGPVKPKYDEERPDSAYSTRRVSPTSNGESEGQEDSRVPPWLRREMLKVDLPDERGMDNQWVRPHSPVYESQPEYHKPAPPPEKPAARPRSAKHTDYAKQSASTDVQAQTTGDLLKDYDQMETLIDSGPKSKYEVHVKTGSRLGASTKAAVKVALYGDRGKAPEVFLTESLSHKVAFQKGQEDEFEIESFHVGTLRKIAIGHDRKELGFGWYLEHVTVHDLQERLTYEVPCGRWLSSREEDCRTIRHFRVESSTNYVEESDASSVYSEQSVQQVVTVSYAQGDLPPRPLNPTHSRSESIASESERTSVHVNSGAQQAAKQNSPRGSSTSRSTYSTTSSSDSSSPTHTNEVSVRDTEASSVRSRKDDFFDQREGGKDYSFVTKSVNREAKAEAKSTELVIIPGVKEDDEDMEREKEEAQKQKEVRIIPEPKIYHLNGETKNDNEEPQTINQNNEADSNIHSEATTKDTEQLNGDKVGQDGEVARQPVMIDTRVAPPPNAGGPVMTSVSITSPPDVSSKNNDNNARADSEDEESTPRSKAGSEYATSIMSGTDSYTSRSMSISRGTSYDTPRSTYGGDDTGPARIQSPALSGHTIHQAARLGEYERVKTLINHNKDIINSTDEKGWTAVHLSAAHGHLELMRWLCEAGADLYVETPTGYYPIHVAAMNNHLQCLQALHSKGASLECQSIDRQTPLHLAAMSGHLQICQWLLSKNCETSSEDAMGRTPLTLAQDYQHHDVVALLRSQNADNKAETESVATTATETTTSTSDSSTSGSSYTSSSATGSVATPRRPVRPTTPSNERNIDAKISTQPDDNDNGTDRAGNVDSARQEADKMPAEDDTTETEKVKTRKEEEELMEKRRVYREQQDSMNQQGGVSFLDSIRNEFQED